MKCVRYLPLHLGNILYKYELYRSLDNKVMNLYLTVCRCDGVSACTAHVTHVFAIFSDRGGQMYCLYPFYISFNGIKYCHLFV